MQKYNNYKKQFEKDQQTIKNFDNFCNEVYKVMQLLKANVILKVTFLLSI